MPVSRAKRDGVQASGVGLREAASFAKPVLVY